MLWRNFLDCSKTNPNTLRRWHIYLYLGCVIGCLGGVWIIVAKYAIHGASGNHVGSCWFQVCHVLGNKGSTCPNAWIKTLYPWCTVVHHCIPTIIGAPRDWMLNMGVSQKKEPNGWFTVENDSTLRWLSPIKNHKLNPRHENCSQPYEAFLE